MMANSSGLGPGGKKKKKQFETDSERIVHRHLQDENDIITDEDIRNIKVGIQNEAQLSRAEEEAPFDTEGIKEISEPNSTTKEGEKDVTTPWDVVE